MQETRRFKPSTVSRRFSVAAGFYIPATGTRPRRRSRHPSARGRAPFGAVIPGPREGDQAEYRVDDLAPVGDEFRLVPAAARGARAPVPAVGGQHLFQHAPAQPQPPGPDHRLRGLQAGVAAAQILAASAARILARRLSPARGPPGSPFLPSWPGRGITAGLARHRRAGLADRLVHLRDLPDEAPEPLVLRDLPPGLVQLRPRPQVHRPRPPFHFPRQVPLRPMTRMIRGGAHAAWFAAFTAHPVQRPPAEVPDLAQLPVQLLARRSSPASSSAPSGTLPPCRPPGIWPASRTPARSAQIRSGCALDIDRMCMM
jgi:hypothetical protein